MKQYYEHSKFMPRCKDIMRRCKILSIEKIEQFMNNTPYYNEYIAYRTALELKLSGVDISEWLEKNCPKEVKFNDNIG